MEIKNYYAKTPVRMRKIGDTILLGSASLSTMIMGLPVSDHQKLWSVFAVNCIGVIGKMLTNFFKEDEVYKKEEEGNQL